MLRPIMDLTKTRPRPGVMITGIRGHHQTNSYSCGEAAVATAYRAIHGELPSHVWKQITDAVKSSCAHGSETKDILRGLRRVGIRGCRMTRINRSSILNQLRRGNLIIAHCHQPHQEDDETHWVVVVGGSTDSVHLLNCTSIPGFSSWRIPWEHVLQEWRAGGSVIAVNVRLEDKVVDTQAQ